MTIANRRGSKYVQQVRSCLAMLGHATNQQITEHCRYTYGSVSSTTIHRITQRMLDDGEIGLAPSNCRGERRYDVNVLPHDHFSCSSCDGLLDIDIPSDLKFSIGDALGQCQIDGRLVISGKCERCVK